MTADRLRPRVHGRTVLVTGASSGIGAASARQLAMAGARVLLVARSTDRLVQLGAEISGAGGTAYPHPADLSDVSSVESLVDDVVRRYGGVDVLVNNAGRSIRRSVSLSYDRFHDFTRTDDVNYRGPVRLTLGLLPGMRARRWGHIVNVSSAGALIPAPRFSAYLASKTAYDVFLRSLVGEVRADNVHISSLYMPLVHTPMVEATPVYRRLPGLTPDEAAQWISRAIAERRRVMAPWYARAGQLMGALGGRPPDRLMSMVYRLSQDSPAARGESNGSAGEETPLLDKARRLLLKGDAR
ncbi:MAG: SDR family NAD(P)-dependent oxidoreductase [Actinomycetes bacterium]